jgi:hypothetical protein
VSLTKQLKKMAKALHSTILALSLEAETEICEWGRVSENHEASQIMQNHKAKTYEDLTN